MVAITSRTINDTFAFGANTSAATLSVDLPRSRWIRRIRIIAEAVVGTVGTSPNAQALPRLLANIAVKADGNTNYFDVSGEDLYQINQRDYSTSILKDATIAAQTTYRQEYILDFALNRKNDFDMSCLLPAHLMNTLQLVLTSNTTLVAAGNADTVLTSLTCYAVVEEVHMTTAEAKEMYGDNYERLGKVFVTKKEAAISAANTNYTGEIDLQVGYIISDVLLRTSDTTTLSAVSTEDLITSYKIEQTGEKGNFIWDEQRWRDAKAQDIAQNGLTSLADTLGSIDINFLGKAGGLDARGMKQGDLKLKFNNTDTSCAYHLTQINYVF